MSGYRALPDDAGNYTRYLAAKIGPRFVSAYYRASARRRNPGPLCIDGREYHRRQLSRKATRRRR